MRNITQRQALDAILAQAPADTIAFANKLATSRLHLKRPAEVFTRDPAQFSFWRMAKMTETLSLPRINAR